MTDFQVLKLVEDEFRDPALSMTKQFLQVHSPVYSQGKPVVLRIDREHVEESLMIVYLPVEGEKFYFEVQIDLRSNEVMKVATEGRHTIYFRATSETLAIDQLMAMTTLTPTEFWNKGDLKPQGAASYKFSHFKILPNPEPDSIEDKLKKLLGVLEQDKDGVRQLAQKAECYIQIVFDVHNANRMIGGFHIEGYEMRRLSDLGLGIDFDVSIHGKPLSDNSHSER